MKKGNLIQTRPAETTTSVVGAVTTLLVLIFKVKDPLVVAAVMTVLSSLPGAVTWGIELWRKR